VSGGLGGALRVAADAEKVAAEAARWLAAESRDVRTRPDRFSIALAGGSTPRTLYQLLATPPYRDTMDWRAWDVFFIDERAAPPDDPRSNYRIASDAVLQHVDIDPGHVHRMEAERADIDAAALEYSQLLANTLPPGPRGAPRLDVVLLGLGENGHVASLFPGTPALQVTDAWATHGVADYAPFERITLTFPTIHAAAAVAFLVVGAAKGDALRQTLAGTVPAARVRPLDGDLVWFLDDDAAGELP
jgi:6-phosphogluconolactonase